MSLFLGIDVGWSETRKTTGVCLLSVEGGTATFQATCTTKPGLQAVLEGILHGEPALDAVAIDGPLRPNLAVLQEHRKAESALSRGKFQRRCQPGSTGSQRGFKLHQEATEIARLFLGRKASRFAVDSRGCGPGIIAENVYEAYPDAFLAVMVEDAAFPVPPAKAPRTDRLWGACVERKLPEIVRLLGQRDSDFRGTENHDERAAVVCALTAWAAHSSEFVAVGDSKGGYIVLPPWALWQNWSRQAICSTAEAAGAVLELRHHTSGHPQGRGSPPAP